MSALPELEAYPSTAAKPVGTVLLVTYYGFKDPISFAAQALAAERQWNVVNYSLFRWKHDQHDRTDRYLDNLVRTAERVRPDALLFWYFGLTREEMQSLRSAMHSLEDPYIPFVLFNWNDPYCWKNSIDVNIRDLAPFFDAVLTCCADVVPSYQSLLHDRLKKRIAEHEGETEAETEAEDEKGVGDLVRVHAPGFHASLASKMRQTHAGPDRFACDVVFACTNLYDSAQMYPEQRLNRRDLIEALYAAPDITLHLYGPERFKELYPNAYRGYLQYEDTYRVVRTARVCFTTHVVSQDVHQYVNERTAVILGCGGLLVTDVPLPAAWNDEVDGAKYFFEAGDTVQETVERIRSLAAQPYDETEPIRERAVRVAARYLTWSAWSAQIDDLLQSVVAHVDHNCSHCPEDRTDRAEHTLHMLQAKTVGAVRTDSGGGGGGGSGDHDNDDENGGGDDGSQFHVCETTHTQCLIVRPPDKDPNARAKSHLMRQPGAVAYDRRREFESIFDDIHASAHDHREFERAMRQFVDVTLRNPTLDVNSLLDDYWRATDRFH